MVTAEVSGDPPDTPAEKEIICLQKKGVENIAQKVWRPVQDVR